MKKLIILSAIVFICIISAVTTLAADDTKLVAEFDNYNLGAVSSIKEMSVEYKNNVFIDEEGENKVLRVAHKTADGSSQGNVISTYVLSAKKEIAITFDVQNRKSSTGNVNVQLRHNDGESPNSTKNLINVLSLNNDTATYLPEMQKVTEPLSESQRLSVTLLINPSTGRFKIYTNGVLKCDVENLYTVRNSAWSTFDFSKFLFRFQCFVKATPESASSPYVTDIIIDNVRVIEDDSKFTSLSANVSYQGAATPITEIKRGPLKAKYTLYNKTNETKKALAFFTHKSDDTLVGLKTKEVQVAPNSSLTFTSPMTVSAIGNDDYLELIVLDPDTLKPIMAPKKTYIKNLVETPVDSELEFLYNKVSQPHPRVIVTKDDFDRLRSLIKTDETAKKWADAIFARADKMVAADINSSSSPYYLKYQLSSTNDILTMSRRVLDMAETLGLAHQLTGDETSVYSEKASLVFLTAGLFKDWNPSHFLDTAEMMASFAIGYDWMYDAFDDDMRAFMEERVYQKGLILAKNAYDGTGGTGNTGWWKNVDYNWNIVCNGGVAIAASAFADVYPELAFELTPTAINYTKRGLEPFAPHGAYEEGATYAIYSLSYLSRMLTTLENTYGTDFGVSNNEGLSTAGDFLIQVDGPTGTNNYHDAGNSHIDSAVLMWLGNTYNNPVYNAFRMHNLEEYNFSVVPLDLIWYNPKVDADDFKDNKLDSYFAGTEFITMRSGYNSNDLFLSAHGGEANISHSHIDGGTFIIDMLGTRFADDIGAEGYGKEGYFGDRRFEYYRARAEGHNTLVINPDESAGQSTNCHIAFERNNFNGENPFAILDMTNAYSMYGASSVKRGYMLCDNRQSVVVRDELELSDTSDVYWFMHTKADVTISGNTATLTRDGKSIKMEFVTNGADAELSVGKAEPLPQSNSTVVNAANNAFKRIIFKTTADGSLNITVKFTPSSGEFADVSNILSLSNW